MTSKDHASTAKALEKADQYIQSPDTDETTTSQDRMLINRSEPSKSSDGVGNRPAQDGGVSVGGVTGNCVGGEQAAFLQSLEEDAQERGEKRKERERKGREVKRKGNQAFKEGDYDSAVRWFTEGVKEAPWDITLYTNRALVC